MATARMQRACYHIRLEREYDEDAHQQGNWRCEDCGKEFTVVIQKENSNANLRENQRI